MRARARRWTAYALSAAIVGCTYLSYDVQTDTLRTWTESKGEDRVAFVRADYDEHRDLLKLEVGDTVTRHFEDAVEQEESVAFGTTSFSTFDATVIDDDDFSLALLLCPITLTIDIVGPVFSLFITPPMAALASTRSAWTTRTPRDVVETDLWASMTLVDGAAGARLTVSATDAQALSAGDLALVGFRSGTLTVASPAGEERKLVLPPAAAKRLQDWGAAADAVPAQLRVEVKPTERLADALTRAAPGAWIQLAEGEYDVPESVFLYGAKLTLVGRGATRTKLRCHGSRALDLRGVYDVTLRGLALAMEGAGVADGIQAGDGALLLQRVAISGTRTEKVFLNPEKPQEASYRSGLGVSCRGAGRTRLESCTIAGASAGALALGTHHLEVDGCAMRGGALEAVSFREQSTGVVFDSTITGDNHGVMMRDEAEVAAERNHVTAAQAGLFVASARRCSASQNTIEGCGTGITIEGLLSNGAYTKNTCRGGGGGILVSAEGTSIEVRDNQCNENRSNGISVQGKAKPTVTGNTCEGNGGAGILYTDETGGLAHGNTLRRNAAGVSLQRAGSPSVENNTMVDNKQAGLGASGTTTARVDANTITGNGMGIAAGDDSQLRATNNTIEHNSTGVQLSDRAGGTYYANRIRNNSGPGVYRSTSGSPTIDANDVSGNSPDTYP